MPALVSNGVKLVGISAAVPHTREDNQHLDSLSEKAKSEIINQVGIRYRYVSNSTETAADLCQISAEKLLDKLGWKASEIGLMILVTQTPDHIVPGSASQLQHKLGLPENAICIDVNQGCAGYVYGMSVLTGLMNAYQIPKTLLLVGDTITKIVSPKDNSLWPIFSDAGSATAFELNSEAAPMHFKLGSKGVDFEAIHVPHGGFRYPINDASLKPESISEGVVRQKNHLSMNGQAVFTFGLSKVASSINALLDEQKITALELDCLVLHQANQLLNNSIVRKTGFEAKQAPSSLYDFGNTSCATIPVTLVSQLSDELNSNSLKLMLTGFGVGLSWGSVILSTEKVQCLPMIYT